MTSNSVWKRSLMVSEVEILQRSERSTEKAMCGVQLKDRVGAGDLMLGLNEMTGQLTVANSVHCLIRC